MSCGACATANFLLADGIGGTVLVCHSFKKGGSPLGFFLVAFHHRLFLLLRFFKLNFTLIFNLCSFFARFFNGLHTCLHVWGQSGLN